METKGEYPYLFLIRNVINIFDSIPSVKLEKLWKKIVAIAFNKSKSKMFYFLKKSCVFRKYVAD